MDVPFKLESLGVDGKSTNLDFSAPVPPSKRKRENSREGSSQSTSSSQQPQNGRGSFEKGQPPLQIKLTDDGICQFCVRLKDECLCQERRSLLFSSASKPPAKARLEKRTPDLVRQRSDSRFDIGTREEKEAVVKKTSKNGEKNERETDKDTSATWNELLLNIIDLHGDDEDDPLAFHAVYLELGEALELSPEHLNDPCTILETAISEIQNLSKRLTGGLESNSHVALLRELFRIRKDIQLRLRELELERVSTVVEV